VLNKKLRRRTVVMKKALSLAALAIATLTGAAFAAEGYDLVVKGASGKAGEKTTAIVTVKAKGAYHMNKEYPHKLLLTAPEGVTIEKAKLVVGDAKLSENELVFKVVATAAAPGKKTIDGELKFATCTETTCVQSVEKVAIQVDAK
jgi:hypothetical protein